jgi:hypothetical protein
LKIDISLGIDLSPQVKNYPFKIHKRKDKIDANTLYEMSHEIHLHNGTAKEMMAKNVYCFFP